MTCFCGLGCAERYKERHPDVLVHLQVENTRRCCAAVARGEVNIGIVGGDVPRELEHLLQVPSCPSPADRQDPSIKQEQECRSVCCTQWPHPISG